MATATTAGRRTRSAKTGPKKSGLDAYMKSRRIRVDETLDRVLPPASEAPRALHEAMRYSVFAGGKRIRPILCLLACRACGGREIAALPSAGALELVHTYSLVHDDLPAMDDDDFRRGKPTCHRKYGDGPAILVGDALLTLAFEVVATRIKAPERGLAVTRTLASAIGSIGMVGGQALDLAGEGRRVTKTRVSDIHRRKTGRLIEASATIGALLAGAPRSVVARIAEYGRAVGLAFQIVDDILDEEGTTEALGKTSGRDRERNKMTYPAAFGMEGAKSAAQDAVERALESARPLDKYSHLSEFALLILNRRT